MRTTAVNYLEKIGFDRLKSHDLEIGKILLEEAEKRYYLGIIAPGNNSERCAIIGLKIKKCHDLGYVARILSDSYGIMCRSGHMCAQPFVDYLANGEIIRAAAYLFNNKHDVIELFQAFDEIQEQFV